MLQYRLFFVAIVLTCFQITSVSSKTAFAGEIAFQEAKKPAAKVKPEKKERLELLMKHKFDRTPQGILEAWSSDKVKKKKKKAKEDEKKPIIAEVTNAFKDFVFLKLADKETKFKKDQVVRILNDKQEVVGEIKILTIDDQEISARIQQPKVEKSDDKAEDKAKPESTEKKSEKQEAGINSGSDVIDIDIDDLILETSVDVGIQDGDHDHDAAVAEKDDEESPDDDADADKKEAKAAKEKPAAELEIVKLNVGDKIELKTIDPKEGAKNQTERLKAEVAEFSRNVSLGNWDKVKEYLSTKIEDKKDAQKLYVYILNELVVSMPHLPKNGAAKRAQAESRGEIPPRSFLSPLDVLALSEISPQPISIIAFKDRKSINGTDEKEAAEPAEKATDKPETDKAEPAEKATDKAEAESKDKPDSAEQKQADSKTDPDATSATEISHLAKLLKQTIEAGYDQKPFLDKVHEGTSYFGGKELGKQLTAAHLFMQCNLYDEAEKFIPALDDEKYHANIYVLRIWRQIADSRFRKKRENKWLNAVWNINQNIFLAESSEQNDIDRALSRLIDISPQMDKEIGQKWLDDSFVESPERGVQILAALGKLSANNVATASSTDDEDRLRMLKLQNRAVEKVLEVSPETASKWGSTLTLLAQNWISEAKISIDEAPNGSNDMNVDRYGNYYWNSYNNNNSKKPIKIIELLPLLPSDKWQSHITPLLLTKIKETRAQLHMHIKEFDDSFEIIRELAEADKEIGKELAEEFIRVWTDFNNPNSSRNQRNSYYYSYGYNQKAESIPLTRSKQDRSLTELAIWAEKVRSLPVEDIDEDLLVTAFQTCYSAAEVFSLGRMEAVLGDISKLKPETIATLSQTMRGNLAGQWLSVKNQEENKTKRTLPEILREVHRGYLVAREMTEQALSTNEDNWELHLAKACLEMDQNEFLQTMTQGLKVKRPGSHKYSELRKQSMKSFEEAAELYIQKAGELERNELETDVFDRWFYASLGAVDLGRLTAKTLPMNSEFPKIKAAIEKLPGDLAEIHMSQFANNLFARMSPIPPELKFRYLEKGFEVVGDHPRAWEAKELYQYYKDLIGEIKLGLRLDGDEKVGTDLFGVYVDLVHTAEIEREAGGFSKYVQNQKQMRYSYNYGRPEEDYQDKFAEGVGAALEEHFDVLSITFMSADGMESRPTNLPGWRVTPYAYITLQAKGSEKDRVPPVSIDMDFLDTSGFVVIPVESTELVIDCKTEPTIRPFDALEITRTLDERQINDGKLIMEVTAKAEGLIPSLDQLIDLDLEDWEIVEDGISDQGCLPSSFDMESPRIQILSDRSWSVEYKVKDEAAEANEFVFSDVKVETKENKIQRYEDADLVAAEPTIQLSKDLAKPNYAWLWISIPLVCLALIGIIALAYFRPETTQQAKEGFEVPEDVNAFTVLSLLKDIKRTNGIDQQQKEELDVSINRIEKFYFGEDKDVEAEDLRSLASTWVSKAK